jgi:hypothetical protein
MVKISELGNPEGYGVRTRELMEEGWEAAAEAARQAEREADEAGPAEAEHDAEPELG